MLWSLVGRGKKGITGRRSLSGGITCKNDRKGSTVELPSSQTNIVEGVINSSSLFGKNLFCKPDHFNHIRFD